LTQHAAYGDAEIKIGLATQGQRDKVMISTKTGARNRDDAPGARSTNR
jgi:aryl-alcohol dehydrogenase-like predicted oxidoreductase